MGKLLHVLIVEDNADHVTLLLEELQRAGYEPVAEAVDTAASMSAALERAEWDLIASDYTLPHFSAPAALGLLREMGKDIPFIIVSGTTSDEIGGAAMNAGAHDYVRHGYLARLAPAVERELRQAEVRNALKRAQADLQASDAHYRALVERIPVGIHTLTLDGVNTLTVSPPLERLLGFGASEWLADPELWRRQLHPEDRDRVLSEFGRLAANGEPFLSEYRMLAHDGRVLWLRDETVIVRDRAGQPQYLQSAKLDITERQRAEAELREAHAKLEQWVGDLERLNREISLLNEMGSQLQACLTIDEAYPVVAHFAQLLFPGSSGALYMNGQSRTSVERVTVWGGTPPEEQVFGLDECWALRRGRLHHVEAPSTGQLCPHLDAEHTAPYLCVPMMAQGEALGVLNIQSGGEQASDHWPRAQQQLAFTMAEHLALALANLKLRETLHLQSSRDEVTGLFNRRYMEETLERELRRADRRQRPLGVIMLDVDQFGEFNERFGHDAAEALLRALGRFMQSAIRGEDVACRYAGEEFALIMPEASLEVTRQRAEELREESKRIRLEHTGEPVDGVSLSLGVAVFPEHGSTVEAILRAAGAALLRDKAEGRDRVEGAAQGAPAAEPETALPVEATTPAPAPAPRLVVGDLSLNEQTYELTVVDRVVMPTPIEYDLLHFLMSNAGKVFTAEQLLQEVWHYPPGTGSQEVVRAHIKNLRGKIEPNPRRPVYLKTIGRFGYTIAIEEGA